MVVLIAVSYLATRRLSIYPSKFQNLMEIVVGGLDTFITDLMGPAGRKFFALIATIFIFILIGNLLGKVPGFESPTANWNTTLAMALIVFIVYQSVGIWTHRFKYIKHFLGPVWWLSPLIFLIEVVSHFVRILSLSVRLFGNMTGGHIAVCVLFFLAPFLIPSAMTALELLVAVIQTMVFVILTLSYLMGAIEEAH
jgi:F-type H+-transporting ATPase subunit a